MLKLNSILSLATAVAVLSTPALAIDLGVSVGGSASGGSEGASFGGSLDTNIAATSDSSPAALSSSPANARGKGAVGGNVAVSFRSARSINAVVDLIESADYDGETF